MSHHTSELNQWNAIKQFFQNTFQTEEELDVEAMLYLIGVQEVGKGNQRYKKDDKVNLMHIAVCRLLSPFGYYEYQGKDEDYWPIYKLVEPLPALQPNEQKLLMKRAIIRYFEEENLL